MMKLLLTYVSLLFVATEGQYGSEKLGVFLYGNLACQPITQSNKLVRYECPFLVKQKGTCQFKDKSYTIGEEVDKKLIYNGCTTNCSCRADAEFQCVMFDCSYQIKPGCSHMRYSLGSCCPVGSVCGKFKTCKVGRKTYREGDLYLKDDTCEECICGEPSQCRRRSCSDQLYFQSSNILSGAPVFSKSDSCCPSTWTTYGGEKIVKVSQGPDVDSGLYCKYGEQKVKLGYGFTKTIPTNTSPSQRIKCECTLTPLLFCKMDS